MPASTLKNPLGWFLGMFPNTRSKVVVNRNTAKTISAVYAAVKIVSEGIASLPFQVIHNNNGDKNIAKMHPVNYLIEKEPNGLQTAFVFWRQLMYDALMKGDGYAMIHRDGSGRPIQLEYILDAEPYVNHDGSVWYYVNHYYGLNAHRTSISMVSPGDMIHISGLSENGLTGIDVILANRENLSISIAATDYASAYFGNGAHVTGVIKHPHQLTADAAARLGRSFGTKYGGLDNVGSVPVLDEGMDFQKIGMTPNEAMLVDVRKFQVEEISRMFRVPLHMLNSMDRATFNNIEVMTTDFVVNTLRPWCEHIEQEVSKKLFTETEKRTGTHCAKFNLDSMLRGDIETRAKYYQMMFQTGAMSPNDIRDREGLNKRTGGDEYFTPLNFTNDPNDPQKLKNRNVKESNEEK